MSVSVKYSTISNDKDMIIGMSIFVMSSVPIKQKKDQFVLLLNECHWHHTVRYAYHYYLNLCYIWHLLTIFFSWICLFIHYICINPHLWIGIFFLLIKNFYVNGECPWRVTLCINFIHTWARVKWSILFMITICVFLWFPSPYDLRSLKQC